jgi:hypothetical protein
MSSGLTPPNPPPSRGGISRFAGHDKPAPERSQRRFDVIKPGGAPPEQASHLDGFPTQSLRELLRPETFGAHCPVDFELGGSRCGQMNRGAQPTSLRHRCMT